MRERKRLADAKGVGAAQLPVAADGRAGRSTERRCVLACSSW